MSIYAIGDLHLALAPEVEKPMDIYGPRWFNHVERLKENWCATIKEGDTIIIPGDISWGLKLDEAKYDLDWVDSLPGHKVMFKGNHDLWWAGINKLNKMYESITFVQNECYVVDDIIVCGSRGWLTPDHDDFKEDDKKIYKREMLRLESSLNKAKCILQEHPDKKILGILHYPPVSKTAGYSGFQQIFENFGVKKVLYGHVHGEEGFKNAIKGEHHGIEYQLVSCDYLNCRPLLIKE